MIERFEGTKDYIATEDLKVAVNAAVTLRRPLLVVRFVVRLRRARMATLALRGSPSATSPGASPRRTVTTATHRSS